MATNNTARQISNTADYEPDDPDRPIMEARVLYKNGVPVCVFRASGSVNYASPLQHYPGWYAAPYSHKFRKILLSNGIDCPPMMENFTYPGPFDPYKHQYRTVAALVDNPQIWCLDDPRTGKTPASCWAMARLLLTGDISRVLILAPKTILTSTWDATLMKILPNIRTEVCDGAVPKFRQACDDSSIKVVIANHDKVKHGLQAIKAGKFDLVIVDEVNKFRHSSADRSRALRVLLSPRKQRMWFLTGTPTSGTPDTLYDLVRLINPVVMKGVSESAWRDMTMNPYFVGDIKKWSQKPGVEPLLRQVLQPCTRAVRAECFDVPPVTYHSRHIDLKPDQKAALETLRKHSILELGDQVITAVNAGVLHSKILQICSGAVYDQDRGTVLFQGAINARADAVIEEWQETGKKVIVLSPFRHTLVAMAEALEKKTRRGVLTLHGGTNNRGDIEPAFQTNDHYQFLVADPEPIQYGMTLSAADSVVWMSPTFKNETWRQANDRPFAALSEDKKQIGIVTLSSTPLERKLYNIRMKEEDRQNTELNMISILEKFLNV